MKRLHAPKKWMLGKMAGVFAPRPSQGPHKLRECIPICVILRDKLKYALTNKECTQICMERCVKVDGKIRTDHNFPTGFMDVVTLEKSGDRYRVLFDAKGRFVLQRLDLQEAQFKLCRVTQVKVTTGKIPVCVTHDGRTIRYPDPDVKVNDSIKVNIETGKMSDILKFELGAMVMLTKGHNCGRIGTLMHIEKHDGSFSIVTIKDSKGQTFCTRLTNCFVIGSGSTPQISVPKGRGIKKSILQERNEAEAAGRL